MGIRSISSDAITDNAGAPSIKKERIGACWLKPTALRDGGLMNLPIAFFLALAFLMAVGAVEMASLFVKYQSVVVVIINTGMIPNLAGGV